MCTRHSSFSEGRTRARPKVDQARQEPSLPQAEGGGREGGAESSESMCCQGASSMLIKQSMTGPH